MSIVYINRDGISASAAEIMAYRTLGPRLSAVTLPTRLVRSEVLEKARGDE